MNPKLIVGLVVVCIIAFVWYVSRSSNVTVPGATLVSSSSGSGAVAPVASFPVGSYVDYQVTLQPANGVWYPSIGVTDASSAVMVFTCSVCAVNADGSVQLKIVGMRNVKTGTAWTNNTWTDSVRLAKYMNGQCGQLGSYYNNAGFGLSSVPTSSLVASSLPAGASANAPNL